MIRHGFMNAPGPNYEIVRDECTPEVLVIRDLGPWNRYPSVTNSAELVVEELASQGQLAIGTKSDGRRLFYYDSNGDRDEILHKDGRFLGFFPSRK